jgi:uncharacterized protein involved in tellurium resistance
MKKQEKIQEAYGEYWEQVKDWVNIDGWFYLNDTDFRLDNKIPLEFDALNNKMRPKSLQGIENNNGWIKIESEEDLPKDNTRCHFIIDGYEELEKQGIYIYGFFWDAQSAYTNKIVTHYQPIIKPEPPIY